MERKYFKNLTEEERRKLKQDIFQRLDIPDSDYHSASSSRKMGWIIGIAASLLFAVSVLVNMMNNPVTVKKVLLAQTNTVEVKQIKLHDSSVVILSPGSKLFGLENAANDRELYLEGSGFFKVQHLVSNKPFIVHANNLEVTVLGTEFNVNARRPEVEVALTKGKVQVNQEQDEKNKAFISPGEKITANGSNFTRSAIDVSMYSAWTNGEWVFRNTTLSDIAALIHQYYSVDIVFENKESGELKMTAVIPVTSVQGLIQVIRETLPVTLTLENQQLIIQ